MSCWTSRLQALFEHHGVLQSTDIQRDLGVSQATVSRLLARSALPLVRFGKGRATRYALRRYPFTHPLALYRIDAGGVVEQIAVLSPLTQGRYLIDQASDADRFWLVGLEGQLFDGLPYYLDDLHPQGFLGHKIARQIGMPDPRQWDDSRVLSFLTESAYGADLPGDLVLGESSLERVRAPPSVTEPRDYPARAEAILAGQAPGSPAGGEQPKFAAWHPQRGHLLVKFSPRLDSAVAQRWRDILIGEQIAARVLGDAYLPVAEATIHEQGDRCFLETPRFDRVGTHGRRPLLSLACLDSEFVGLGQNWIAILQALFEQQLVDELALERAVLYKWFGQWIGNTDMHAGNLSLAPNRDSGRFTLLPAYDMASMRFAPQRGELPPITLPTPPVRQPRYADLWRQAAGLARQYWQSVLEDPRLSADFQRIAARCLEPFSRFAPDELR